MCGHLYLVRYSLDEAGGFPVLFEDLDENASHDFDLAKKLQNLGINQTVKEAKGSDFTHSILYRSCKVLTHEAGHLFGIRHCTYYECLMCGCNHLEEFDKRPLHLCPIDLRKLQSTCKFDVIKRYEAMLKVAQKLGWEEPLGSFLKKRLSAIATPAMENNKSSPKAAASGNRRGRTMTAREGKRT
eukprot:CAMPEP_0184506292 /NCGR_PEP_ID=MMETSP0113_2-20130426/53426_1 /TAXON_ID=91329 /ORGANISM="Norrisiella sphaerica, Strain BC52" /LENGTH=184 /DNA_ID=CAMNT_0026896005 /DNA_START=490 /DNA_END=1041 /DNA_ORIENTATION=-